MRLDSNRRRNNSEFIGGIMAHSWYAAWQEETHAELYGAASERYLTWRLIRICSRYNEVKLLRTLVNTFPCRTISDIGCGAGRFYPVFRKLWPAATYKGFDISGPAIEKAQRLYPRGNFYLLRDPMTPMPEAQSDLVFSRDVVMHTIDPRQFLGALYEIAAKYLVLRVRTKERGETVYDPEQSCKYAYGHWVPYIVFNTSELISVISSYMPRPMRLIVLKHPVILGGHDGRFLPKEMYYPETGTAETAILIEKGESSDGGEPFVDIGTAPEADPDPALYRTLRNIARRLRI